MKLGTHMHLCVCDRVDAVTNNSSRRHGRII